MSGDLLEHELGGRRRQGHAGDVVDPVGDRGQEDLVARREGRRLLAAAARPGGGDRDATVAPLLYALAGFGTLLAAVAVIRL